MEQSILDSTKKVLGLDPSYTAFDTDILTGINTVLATLHQLGIGPDQGFSVEGPEQTWANFIGLDPALNTVRSYVHLRVRLLFDPPATTFHINSLEAQVKELEWRISTYREVNRPEEVVDVY